MNRASIFFPACILLLLCIPVIAWGQYVWAPTALVEYPTMQSIVAKVIADPVDPDVVWGLTVNTFDPFGVNPPDPADGIWKSTDKGVTWTQMNDVVLRPDYSVMDIAICEANNDLVYAATLFQGVFRSTDAGNSWITVNNGLTHKSEYFPNTKWAVLSVAVHPEDPYKVFCSIAQVSEIDILSLALDHPGFYRSTNGGNSWVASNTGLPNRAGTKTAVVANISFVPQVPKYMVCGMIDLEAKFSVLFGAQSRGRVFYSKNNGQSFVEASAGLPTVEAGVVFLGASISGSIMYVTPGRAGKQIVIYGSHLGLKGEISLLVQEGLLASGGVHKVTPPQSMNWSKASGGLPVVTDDMNDHSTNAGVIAPSPTDSDIALVGIFLADSENPNANNNKVWATTNGGGYWIKGWDSGMKISPHGYYYAVPIMTCFNANQTAAYSSVHWEDENNLGEDSGVWRLPPTQRNSSWENEDEPVADTRARCENPFARLPFPLNMVAPRR
jgi:hypothetical protein